MEKRVILFTFSFVTGVALAMIAKLGPEPVAALYIAAAVFGLPALILLFLESKNRWQRPSIVYFLLVASAISLGSGRYAQRTYIAPFSEAADANHIKAFVEKFPDIERDDRTRFVGRIVSEPQFRPAGDGKPGVLALIVEPVEMQPDTDSPKSYPISEGNVMVFLRPARLDDADFAKVFGDLALFDAYGYTVEVDAQVQGFRPAENPGLFDAESFNNDKDVFASSSIYFWDPKNPPIKIVERTRGAFMLEFALDLKTSILSTIKQTVPFPESAFLAGVTLGAAHGLDGVRNPFEATPEELSDPSAEQMVPDLRQFILDEFRWSGTSHVLAVSGLHVTIITGALWGLFLSLKIPQKIYAPLVVIGLATFCLITGAAPSSMRAAIMNSLVVLTYVYLGSSFRASLLLAIGVSGFFILMDNPKWLIQPSFALSFMAVLSLGLLTPAFESVMKKVPGIQRLPSWFQQFIYAQGSIQFGMMGPLSAYYFCRMSIAGPIANFLAIPLIGIIVQLGIFAGAIGAIPVVGIYLALVLNAANYILIVFFLWTAHISTVLFPFPMVQTFTPRMLVAYYILLAFFAAHQPLLRFGKILYYDLAMGIGGMKRRIQAVTVFSVSFILIASTAVYGFWPRVPAGKLRVDVLAVRYGNAIRIETPGGAQILVDGGGNDYRTGWSVGERTIAQYLLKERIGRLDAVIMTNTSPEDMGGLSGVLKIFPVKRFYSVVDFWNWDLDDPDKFRTQVSEGVQNDAAETPRSSDFEDAVFHFAALNGYFNRPFSLRRGIEVLLTSPSSLFTGFGQPIAPFKVEAGMVIWKEKDFEILALAPNPSVKLSPSNENSIVLRITYGATSFLLTSDITRKGMEELSRLDPKYLKSDFVVLPAHGSSKADLESFYDLLFPSGKGTAVLSYGWTKELKGSRDQGKLALRDSFLSHRQLFDKDVASGAEATVRALKERGITVARTDEHGAIIASSDGVKVSFKTTTGAMAEETADALQESDLHKEL